VIVSVRSSPCATDRNARAILESLRLRRSGGWAGETKARWCSDVAVGCTMVLASRVARLGERAVPVVNRPSSPTGVPARFENGGDSE
jgi:hypothetical protein